MVTVPRISATLPKRPIKTESWPAWPWMLRGPAAAVAPSTVSSPVPVLSVVRREIDVGDRAVDRECVAARAAEDGQAGGVGVVDRRGRKAGDLAVRAVIEEQRGLAGGVSRVVERQVGEAEAVVDVDGAEQVLHADDRSAPSVTVSWPSWPWISSVLSPVAKTLVVSSPVPVFSVVG